MLFLIACTTAHVTFDTGFPSATANTVGEAAAEAENLQPLGQYPALQSPLDGTEITTEVVEFKVVTQSPSTIYVYPSEDLSNAVANSERMNPQDGEIVWQWDRASEWSDYTWYAENETGPSVMWNFHTRGQNAVPETPILEFPEPDSYLTVSELAFELSGGMDPDGDPVVYTIVVTKDNAEVAKSSLLSVDDLPWTPNLNVGSDTPLCWTAWATDDKDEHGPYAEEFCFELSPD